MGKNARNVEILCSWGQVEMNKRKLMRRLENVSKNWAERLNMTCDIEKAFHSSQVLLASFCFILEASISMNPGNNRLWVKYDTDNIVTEIQVDISSKNT